MITANVNWEIITHQPPSKWFLLTLSLLACFCIFYVFAFILRTAGWGGTVLILPASQNTEAIRRWGVACNLHLNPWRAGICILTADMVNSHALHTLWLLLASGQNTMAAPPCSPLSRWKWAALPQLRAKLSPEKTLSAFSQPRHVTLGGWLAEGGLRRVRKTGEPGQAYGEEIRTCSIFWIGHELFKEIKEETTLVVNWLLSDD